MAVDIVVPSVGESITEGTIGRWLKANGSVVKANEPVCELETDKATTDVMAPAGGRLTITTSEGQKVAIGAVIGRIEEGATSPVPSAASSPPPSRPAARDANKHQAVSAPAPAPRTGDGEPILSPAARQVAANEGIDPHQLSGSGRGGRITKEDVLTHLQQRGTNAEKTAVATPPAPPPAPVPAVVSDKKPANHERERRERMTPIRARIAERLLAAQQSAAILTTFNEADMSAVMALRTKYKETFQKKHGVGLGFMSFFVKSADEALRAFPTVNASIDGNDIVYHNYYDIGVAVSTEKGLMVPVLRNADEL